MCRWSSGRGCLGRVGLGRPGGAVAREPWPAGLTVWGWLVVVVGVGNTPAVVGCCGLVVVVVCWWWVPSRVLGACGGGMLSGFWGSAPWLPDPSGAPGCRGLWVGVGGLVVNCIVDASILL